MPRWGITKPLKLRSKAKRRIPRTEVIDQMVMVFLKAEAEALFLASGNRKARKVKIYLIPKKENPVGDVVVIPRPRWYFGFVDHIDLDTTEAGKPWVTIYFDCMDVLFVQQYFGAMAEDDFPFNEIALAADSCVFELSMYLDRFQAIDEILANIPENTIKQGLREGTWWLLGERLTYAPNVLPGLKHTPFPGSTDPTTIITAGVESITAISDLRYPGDDVLKALVPISHRTEELRERYPGR